MGAEQTPQMQKGLAWSLTALVAPGVLSTVVNVVFVLLYNRFLWLDEVPLHGNGLEPGRDGRGSERLSRSRVGQRTGALRMSGETI